jgi:hypothetical protein
METFVEINGLDMFEKWLGKIVTVNSIEHEPNLSIRKTLMEILYNSKFKREQLSKAQ